MIDDTARDFLRLADQMRRLTRRSMPGMNEVPKSEFFFLCNIREYLTDKRREGQNPPGVTVSELGRILEISTPAISKMLRSVEEKGLVARLPDKRDRRIVYLNLTDEGNALLAGCENCQLMYTIKLVERMGEENAKEFLRLFTILFDIMKEEQEEDVND